MWLDTVEGMALSRIRRRRNVGTRWKGRKLVTRSQVLSGNRPGKTKGVGKAKEAACGLGITGGRMKLQDETALLHLA